jgi:hypothetical protein
LTSWLSSTSTSEVVCATHRIDDFLPIAGGFVIDFLVVSALIRLESSSVVTFGERFIEPTANGKSPMCIIPPSSNAASQSRAAESGVDLAYNTLKALGLEHSIPTIARWRLSSLPKYLPAQEVERLIDSCDQSSPLGARDLAILLLIARPGLRASDVSASKFGDLL